MKYVKSILFVVLIAISMAYTTRDAKVSQGLNPGDRAPEIHLQHFSLGNNYTLLQFWAAYDATSRANNILISNKLAQLNREDVQMISVSFDERVSVFEETVKADKLDPSTQFNVLTGRNSKIFEDYDLGTGFKNVLIDPSGVIRAVNVSPDRLQEVLGAI